MKQITVIPAEPGWFVLESSISEDGTVVEFFTIPILGWCAEVDSNFMRDPTISVYPLSYESLVSDPIILRPDGICVIAEDRTGSREEAMEWAIGRVKRRQKK